MAVGENNLRKITQLYEHIKVHRKGLPRRLHTSVFVRVTRAQGHFRARLGLKTFCHTCVPFMRRAVSVLAFDWIFRHNILGQERSAPQKVAVPDVHVSFFFWFRCLLANGGNPRAAGATRERKICF